nr:hypothetical protein [Paraburkholderia strydomiana]
MRNLALLTGLTQPSLYNAFGDKRALVSPCLGALARENAKSNHGFFNKSNLGGRFQIRSSGAA